MALYLLHECAAGYGLFERVEADEVGANLDAVQKSVTDLTRFSKVIKLKAFAPFTSAESALENIHRVSEGELTEFLKDFLELHLPKLKPGKKSKYTLGVTEPKIGNVVQEVMNIKCESSALVLELLRGIRTHFTRFIKALKDEDLTQSQLGLGHSYSRSKVKFNVHKVDNMIIQSIALLDQLDKDLNTFAMRVREWYSWHFPELVTIVNDNYMFCRLTHLIKNKGKLTEESLPQIEEVVGDATKAQEVLDAAKMSMGTDVSDFDMINIDRFAVRVIKLAEFRQNLHKYLVSKMDACAPNLTALLGEQVGARLISHAGSLTNLAKYPASTVQILGAEKALFRALKTKGNTPKYGLIFHSTFIGRAQPKNKGRMARYVANKASIASRIDSFSDVTSNQFGLKLREQVEERLEFYKTGKPPRKNLDVMHGVIEDMGGDATAVDGAAAASSSTGATPMDEEKETPKKKKKNKRKAPDEPTPAAEVVVDEKDLKKAKKKAKKAAEAAAAAQAAAAAAAAAIATPKSEKKKKKKKKDKDKE